LGGKHLLGQPAKNNKNYTQTQDESLLQ
jgi:hypothetical protein